MLTNKNADKVAILASCNNMQPPQLQPVTAELQPLAAAYATAPYASVAYHGPKYSLQPNTHSQKWLKATKCDGFFSHSLNQPLTDMSDDAVCPQPSAPPLNDLDDDLAYFAKCRNRVRDEMIQVEGIPKLYILVDFEKWGSPRNREKLKSQSDASQKMKRRIKKVAFSEETEVIVFASSPSDCARAIVQQDALGNAWGRMTKKEVSSSSQQAYSTRKKTALYSLEKSANDTHAFWA
jgi:hypothetical protein